MLDKQLLHIKRQVTARGLTLGPVLSEAEVARFEEQTGCALPVDYRRFVTEIGNGGDGPTEDGLMALGLVPCDYHHSANEVAAALSRPFPLTGPHVEDPAAEGGSERLDIVDGALHLGSDGCGSYWLLIVSGDQRGKVWNSSDGAYSPCEPPKSFVTWYQEWLDDDPDWDLCAEPEPPAASLNSIEGQREALFKAEQLLSEGDAKAALVLVDSLHHEVVATRKRFVRARALVELGGSAAVDAVRALVLEWLAPAAVGSVNQAVERAEMLGLLDALDHPDTVDMAHRIRDAPVPEVAVHMGDDFF